MSKTVVHNNQGKPGSTWESESPTPAAEEAPVEEAPEAKKAATTKKATKSKR